MLESLHNRSGEKNSPDNSDTRGKDLVRLLNA